MKKEYKVVFKEATILVKRITASDHTSSGIEKALEKGQAKYMVDNIIVKILPYHPGISLLVEDRLFNVKFQTE